MLERLIVAECVCSSSGSEVEARGTSYACRKKHRKGASTWYGARLVGEPDAAHIFMVSKVDRQGTI